MEPIYNYFKEVNPRACEESVWSNNDSDDVVGFCVEVPDGSKTKTKCRRYSTARLRKVYTTKLGDKWY